MKSAKLVLLALLITCAPGCAGNQAALQAEIDRLGQENQALKQENASLSAEIKRLRQPKPRDDIEVSITPVKSSGKVHLTVQRDGSIVVDGEELTIEALPDRLTKVYQEDKQTQVVLHTEKGVPYQRVVEVLDVVSSIGFDRLAMDSDGTDE
jgi:biopolymer transport protein ExbD